MRQKLLSLIYQDLNMFQQCGRMRGGMLYGILSISVIILEFWYIVFSPLFLSIFVMSP